MTKQKVQVWVFYRNPKTFVYSFLILRTNPARGGFWQPVTGGVEKGETRPEAALREVFEETGIQAYESLEPIDYHFEFKNRGETFVEYGFSLQLKDLEEGKQPEPPIRLDPNEHVDYQWTTAKDAFKTIGHASNAAMLKALLAHLAKRGRA